MLWQYHGIAMSVEIAKYNPAIILEKMVYVRITWREALDTMDLLRDEITMNKYHKRECHEHWNREVYSGYHPEEDGIC